MGAHFHRPFAIIIVLFLFFSAIQLIFPQPSAGLASFSGGILADGEILSDVHSPEAAEAGPVWAMHPSTDVNVITLDATVRDFLDSHPDFEVSITELTTGLVGSTLGEDDKPVFVAEPGTGGITDSDTFDQWYKDVAGVNLATVAQIPLAETEPGSGMFVFEDNAFFPIDEQLFGNQGRDHNYHFTLELHTLFTYQGGEIFRFTGDDDVWVFINKRLVVDLGGVHVPVSGEVALDTLGLVPGVTYNLDMFFAERRTRSSVFRVLTSIDTSTAPFLELPVNYTNFEQAASGSNRGIGPGRVNSWFDHEYPFFTGAVNCRLDFESGPQHDDRLTNWRTATESPSSICTCAPGVSCYDGHNGIDFRHAHLSDEPVLAAAAGVVIESKDNCQVDNSCGDFGNWVQIDHGNCYSTFYGHLERLADGMGKGVNVVNQQQVGVMGNTGLSAGTHLHFGLYKDPGCDGDWSDQVVVDPYGWSPISADPWENSTTRSLWKHPLGQQEPINDTGGTLSSPSGAYKAGIPPGAVSDWVTMELLVGPPQAVASAELRSAGHSFWIRVFEWLLPASYGAPGAVYSDTDMQSFSKPISVTMSYADEDVRHLNEQQLLIYRWDDSQSNWLSLPTSVDNEANLAQAFTTETGNFTLQAPLMCSEDTAEPDDNYDAASFILFGNTEKRLFDSVEDEDWLKLTTFSRATYVIHTDNLATGVDTVVEVYDQDGVTLLARDDNGGAGAASRLVWKAPLSGTYFVRVAQAGNSHHGCDATYELGVIQNVQGYLPFVTYK